MVSRVAGGVLDHADSDIAKVACAPEGNTSFALMDRGLDGGPIGGSEGYSGQMHECLREAKRIRLTGPACTEALNEAEEA